MQRADLSTSLLKAVLHVRTKHRNGFIRKAGLTTTPCPQFFQSAEEGGPMRGGEVACCAWRERVGVEESCLGISLKTE